MSLPQSPFLPWILTSTSGLPGKWHPITMFTLCFCPQHPKQPRGELKGGTCRRKHTAGHQHCLSDHPSLAACREDINSGHNVLVTGPAGTGELGICPLTPCSPYNCNRSSSSKMCHINLHTAGVQSVGGRWCAGKSALMQYAISQLEDAGKRVQTTALTGIAAELIGGEAGGNACSGGCQRG